MTQPNDLSKVKLETLGVTATGAVCGPAGCDWGQHQRTTTPTKNNSEVSQRTSRPVTRKED